MNNGEKNKLQGWSALRGKDDISFIDVLSIQPKAFWVALAFGFAFGMWVFWEPGPNSLPFGVFIGGMASTLGYLLRIKRNLAADLRYIDWKKVGDALHEQAPNK